jgi:hypothetical protein
MKVWLEDNLPSELLDIMENDKGAYSSEKQKAILSEVYFGLVENRKVEFKKVAKSRRK